MEIELIATGDELLEGTIADGNGLWLMERLAALGLPVRRKTTVRDRRDDILDAFRAASGRSDLLICSGGLGPTSDDITAECAAEAAGAPLVQDDATWESIRARLERRGIAATENNRRQAMVPKGARVHANRFGTAPMIEVAIGRSRAFLLPGVPREFVGLCEEILLPQLGALSAGAPVRRVRVLRCFGIAESHLDDALDGLAARFPGLSIGYRTTLPENHVRLVVVGPKAEQADAVLEEATREALRRIGPACFGSDGATLPGAVARALRARNATVALAESLTAGLGAALLADEPGASDWLRLSVVAYTDDAKRAVLGIPAELLATDGAVSERVAAAMAEGARRLGGSTFGLSCTGLAGPGTGGSPEPVGTVFTALSAPDGETRVVRHRFGGDRERIRRFTAYAMADALRRHLGGTAGPA